MAAAAGGAGMVVLTALAATADEDGELPTTASQSEAGSWPSLRPEAKGCCCAGTRSPAAVEASKVAGPVAQGPSVFGQPEMAGRRLRSSGNIVSSASNTSRLPPVKLFLRSPYRDR